MLRTPCHAERSEASRGPTSEALRYPQGDKQRPSPCNNKQALLLCQPPSPCGILHPNISPRRRTEPGGAAMSPQQLHQPGMSVHPATSTVPLLVCAKAKAVVFPPLSSPKTRVVIGSLLCILVTCKAYILPSNETFDQGYCVKRLRLLSLPVSSAVRRVRPEPSEFIFHNPFCLVTAIMPLML
jgi:hypothetical protein